MIAKCKVCGMRRSRVPHKQSQNFKTQEGVQPEKFLSRKHKIKNFFLPADLFLFQPGSKE